MDKIRQICCDAFKSHMYIVKTAFEVKMEVVRVP